MTEIRHNSTTKKNNKRWNQKKNKKKKKEIEKKKKLHLKTIAVIVVKAILEIVWKVFSSAQAQVLY